MLNVSESMKCYRLDGAGMLFVVNLMRDVLTSLPSNNDITLEIK